MFVPGESLNSGLRNLTSRNWEHRSVVGYEMCSISWTV